MSLGLVTVNDIGCIRFNRCAGGDGDPNAKHLHDASNWYYKEFDFDAGRESVCFTVTAAAR